MWYLMRFPEKLSMEKRLFVQKKFTNRKADFTACRTFFSKFGAIRRKSGRKRPVSSHFCKCFTGSPRYFNVMMVTPPSPSPNEPSR